MKLIIFVLSFLSIHGYTFGQDSNKKPLKKYNKKRFSRNNHFYIYSNQVGVGSPKDTLRLVTPHRAFWGSLREEGSLVVIKQDRIEKQLIGEVKWITIDSVAVKHPTGTQVATATQYYFPENVYTTISDTSLTTKSGAVPSIIKYRDYKFVLQGMTIPLKFRKAMDTIPYQAETGVNIGFGAGIKWSYNWYNAEKSFLGQKTNQLSFTPGVLFGLGAVDVKAKTSAPPTFKDRKEPIFSYGGFFMVGLNSINIGFAIGKDKALKDAGDANGWFYHNKTWKGIIVALDIIK